MASKSTNGTIFTVAIVALAAFVVWQLFGKKSTPRGQAGSGGSGGAGGDVITPYDPYSGNGNVPSSKSGLGLSAGTGSGTGSGKGSRSSSSGSSGNGGATDFLNSLKEGLYPTAGGGYGVMGSESDPEFGGDSLLTVNNLSAYGNESGMDIPLEDQNQQLTDFGYSVDDASSHPSMPSNSDSETNSFADYLNNFFDNFWGPSTSSSDLSIPTVSEPANGYSDTSGISELAEANDIATEIQDSAGDNFRVAPRMRDAS